VLACPGEQVLSRWRFNLNGTRFGRRDSPVPKNKKKHHRGSGDVALEGLADGTSNGQTSVVQELSRKEYERKLKPLHVELVKLQLWAQHSGLRAVVVFEGRDAAGKGGVIKAITERVSPRVFRVVALPAPSERQKTQMYLQRYLEQMPAAGEIILFDRSWYNRAGVEHVMGFCTEDEYHTFLQGAPPIERAIIQNGIILIKYWFEVSQERQTERFQERIDDGRKIWKLSGMDLEAHRRWYDYSRARDNMFAATDTDFAPWNVVNADDSRRARLNCIAHLLSTIPYQDVPRERVKLSDREAANGYVEPQWRRHMVPEVY
jgi:polyphosphate kinase 2